MIDDIVYSIMKPMINIIVGITLVLIVYALLNHNI